MTSTEDRVKRCGTCRQNTLVVRTVETAEGSVEMGRCHDCDYVRCPNDACKRIISDGFTRYCPHCKQELRFDRKAA